MRPRRLVIVSSVVHYRWGDQLWAYGPYAREIDVWADLFAEVEIAAPCRDASPASDCVAFSRNNIRIRRQVETGGDGWPAKFLQAVQLPRIAWGLTRAMAAADAVHVRCPGNLGLLGVALAPLCSRLRVAKYAGQWCGDDKMRWVNRVQRALLRSQWWGSPVTVYGRWPGEPPHVHPFFTSMMTAHQVQAAAHVAQSKRISSPLRVLYCGRLTPDKRIDQLLKAARLVIEQGLAIEVAILGEGPDRDRLERMVAEVGIGGHVEFVGGVPFDAVMGWYDWAHCLVLPSASEGWPKVLAEAMCHGVLGIAVGCGFVPEMLDQRGIALQQGTAEEIAAALRRVADDPPAYLRLAADGAKWAQQYSLEGLRDALAKLLSRAWQVPIAATGAAGTCELNVRNETTCNVVAAER